MSNIDPKDLNTDFPTQLRLVFGLDLFRDDIASDVIRERFRVLADHLMARGFRWPTNYGEHRTWEVIWKENPVGTLVYDIRLETFVFEHSSRIRSGQMSFPVDFPEEASWADVVSQGGRVGDLVLREVKW